MVFNESIIMIETSIEFGKFIIDILPCVFISTPFRTSLEATLSLIQSCKYRTLPIKVATWQINSSISFLLSRFTPLFLSNGELNSVSPHLDLPLFFSSSTYLIHQTIKLQAHATRLNSFKPKKWKIWSTPSNSVNLVKIKLGQARSRSSTVNSVPKHN